MPAQQRLGWAAWFTGATGALHLVIIVGGPAWYRFFGAGERMARLAEQGRVLPTIVTRGIASILGVWASGSAATSSAHGRRSHESVTTDRRGGARRGA